MTTKQKKRRRSAGALWCPECGEGNRVFTKRGLAMHIQAHHKQKEEDMTTVVPAPGAQAQAVDPLRRYAVRYVRESDTYHVKGPGVDILEGMAGRKLELKPAEFQAFDGGCLVAVGAIVRQVPGAWVTRIGEATGA